MPLTLSLTGGEMAAGQRQTRTLRTGRLSIGRAAGNDWVLADPERVLSKTHCIISAEDGRYVLTDTSSNGIYINGAQRPTQRDSQVDLVDGDQLRLSNYVITVSEVADMPAAAPAAGREGGSPLDIDPLEDPLGRGPDPGFQHPIAHVPAPPRRGDDPFDIAGERERQRRPTNIDDDLFRGAMPSNAWKGPTQADHADPLNHAFAPPKASVPIDIDDIDFDDLIGDPTPPAAPPPAAAWPPPAPPPVAPPPVPPARPAAPTAAPTGRAPTGRATDLRRSRRLAGRHTGRPTPACPAATRPAAPARPAAAGFRGAG